VLALEQVFVAPAARPEVQRLLERLHVPLALG